MMRPYFQCPVPGFSSVAADRSVRLLDALSGASTSRVLNLFRIARDNINNPEHAEKPLFLSPIINRAFILKHRARSDEIYLFPSPRSSATKIVTPFDETDLRAGGRSLFVDQRGYREALRQMGAYRDEKMERDFNVMRLLDAVPSLDPFLLREHLRNHEIEVAPCYFSISQGDQERMHRFVTGELSRLVALAGGSADSASSNRMVAALLSSKVDEKLEPLRLTLGLTGNDFREGVFSWRGFIYYKWSLMEFWPDLIRSLRELKVMKPFGPVNSEQKSQINAARTTILRGVKQANADVNRILDVYNTAYEALIEKHEVRQFREFLLSAPALFLEIGERMGTISHITSF